MEPTSATPIRISVVIPAYNEVGYLPRLLDTIDAARDRYEGGKETVEVIVADNASTDRTAQIAGECGCRVVRVEKRAIGAVRNGGAAVARGDILAFVDADFRIHPETFNAIDGAVATGKVAVGATGMVYERMSLGLWLSWALSIVASRLTATDMGVIFCRREDFEAIGGYCEEKLYFEDIQFLTDLKRLGRPEGRKLVRCTTAKAICSMRKWDERGDWDLIKGILKHAYYFALPARARRARMEKFAKEYWYDDPR